MQHVLTDAELKELQKTGERYAELREAVRRATVSRDTLVQTHDDALEDLKNIQQTRRTLEDLLRVRNETHKSWEESFEKLRRAAGAPCHASFVELEMVILKLREVAKKKVKRTAKG